MEDVSIDLDEPAAAPAPPASVRRVTPIARTVALLALAIAAGAPQGPPTSASLARTLPLPSYCTGTPIPGGRLNLIQDGRYIILDATTNTIISEGLCPHGRAGG
jgi:hypothetical protein